MSQENVEIVRRIARANRRYAAQGETSIGDHVTIRFLTEYVRA